MIRRLTLLTSIALGAALSIQAQDDGLGTTLNELGKNASIGYMTPFVTAFGTGMNGGWANSAKPFSLFNRLPVGVSVANVSFPLIVISDEMKTFDFSGTVPLSPMLKPLFPQGVSLDSISSIVQQATLSPAVAALIQSQLGISPDELGFEENVPVSVTDVPTVFGSTVPESTTVADLIADTRALNTLKAYNLIQKATNADTIALNKSLPLPFVGAGDYLEATGNIFPALPTVTVQVGVSKIPLINNFTLSLRLLPEIPFELNSEGTMGGLSELGVGFQYSFLHLVPVVNKFKFLNASALLAFNNLTMDLGSATFTQHNWIAGLNGSLDKNFGPLGIGAFGGIAIENSTLNLKADGSSYGLPDFEVDIEGKNTVRISVGPRFTVGFVDVWGKVNVGSITSFEAGVNLLSLNGHGL